MLPCNGKKVKLKNNLHMTWNEVQQMFSFLNDKVEWEEELKDRGIELGRNVYHLKYKVIYMLLLTTPLRPKAILAININDFNRHPKGDINYESFNYREAKTNKYHPNEILLPRVAKLVKRYCKKYNYTFREGFLFSTYKQLDEGKVYMSSSTLRDWFTKHIRKPLGKINPEWLRKYPIPGSANWQYRIQQYSLRRFYQTYFYLKNGGNPLAREKLKTVLHYGPKFNPLAHYIKVVNTIEEREKLIKETFSPLAEAVIS